ncbi:MAG: hypothetical protein INR71_07980, partial [Terriglobus roseus]|nr:hypothetical protein [Terriglobus roseus]
MRESSHAEDGFLAKVNVPEEEHDVLRPDHPAISILANSTVVIQRQLEMMNVLLGFEQANRYVIMNPQGDTIGYLAERDHGIGQAMVRQMARTHRSFTTHVFDGNEREVLRFHRPFSWINSRIRVYDAWDEGPHDESSALSGLSTSSLASQTSSQ